jgi:UDP-glucose 4-epimerase
MIKAKKILITGGSGFIGSHLANSLNKENYVLSIDNYSSGKKSREHKGVSYLTLDCKNIFSLNEEFEPDIIYHLGEYSRVENSLNDPSKVFDNNIEGTFKMLQYAKEKKAKLVYAGSSTKFGDNGKNRYESPYAFTKAMNTELVKNYCFWNNIKYAITYFYNVYGDGENDNGEFATVIGIFKRLYKSGLPISVVEPGTQKRNFTHINDIVNGLLLVGEKGLGDNYGIGAKQSYSIIEVANMFSDNIEIIPERKGNRMDSILNSTKTEKLGWKCNECLEDYIHSFKNNLY